MTATAHDKLSPDEALAQEFRAHLAIMNERLERALGAAGAESVVVFAGAEHVVFRDDLLYPFHVEPYFKAWVPLTYAPGSVLLLKPGERPRLIYYQPDDFWFESPSEPQGFWVEHFDVLVAKSAEHVGGLLRSERGRLFGIGQPPEHAPRDIAMNPPKLLTRLDFYRAFKTDYEITCMMHASARAARGHEAVRRAFRERAAAGVSEFDLHQTFCAATGQRESDLPYPSIIGLNEHAAILHYQNLRTEPPPIVRSLLIDAGAQFLGYASDVTRTWSSSAADFRALIDSTEQLQQRLCAAARKGVDFVELNETAHRLLAEMLADHGLITCAPEEALARGITTAFLPHGLGHLLGLQVHDAGGRQISPDGEQREPPAAHPYLRLTRTLEPGFVVTIEPGIYFIASLLEKLRSEHSATINWPAVERFVPFGGIRIEDNVLVTEDKPRNLTREAFATLMSNMR